MIPAAALITLTGEDPAALGRGRSHFRLSAKGLSRLKKIGKGAGWTAAAFLVPGATAAAAATIWSAKAIKRRKAAAKAKKAREKKAAAARAVKHLEPEKKLTPEAEAAIKATAPAAAPEEAAQEAAPEEAAQQEAAPEEAAQEAAPEEAAQQKAAPEEAAQEAAPEEAAQEQTAGIIPYRKPPLYIQQSEIGQSFGFIGLSADEQLSRLIYDTTKDKTFYSIIPLTYPTRPILALRSAAEDLKAQNIAQTPAALKSAVSTLYPKITEAAINVWQKNEGKTTGLIPSPTAAISKITTPVFWIAGIGAAAFLLMQLRGILPKKQPTANTTPAA